VCFYDDESCFQQSYDLVVASNSLQYSEDWRKTFHQLAEATQSYLYITALPVVAQVSSFVVLQRSRWYSGEVEYRGWFINHDDLLLSASEAGMVLKREFVIMLDHFVRGAPEQGHYRGFLFATNR
jgi:putative methyltransferase (TIGR04325 family)